MSKGGKTREESTRPGIEKFIYVLEGKIEANIGEEKYNLMKGDTLYFEGATPHCFKNTHNHDTKLLCMISPPTS
jgi:quercetin dioxygenase-like cupin family protein